MGSNSSNYTIIGNNLRASTNALLDSGSDNLLIGNLNYTGSGV